MKPAFFKDAKMMLENIEKQCAEAMKAVCLEHPDPSHDFSHVQRVVKLTKWLCEKEGGNLHIALPAAYLHDFESVSKTDSRRSQASKLSAAKAQRFLEHIQYPSAFLEDITHAIEAHSFSAKIEAKTLEAKIVQDADRLDGIGAIGIARCFGLSGLLKREFYNFEDPFCERRLPNDQSNSVDHFYVKLLKVPEMLNTKSAKEEGEKRTLFMKNFLSRLKEEI